MSWQIFYDGMKICPYAAIAVFIANLTLKLAEKKAHEVWTKAVLKTLTC